MALLMVRHGQAQATSDDYDRLSDLGKLQSQRLGLWLADTGQQFDAVICGNMRRHRETLEAIASATASRGMPLPTPQFDDDLEEFDHRAVYGGFARQQPQNPAVRAAHDGSLKALGTMIHAAMLAWSEDRIEGVPERWEAFGERVRRAGERLSHQAEARVLVVTSGGVISHLTRDVLGLSALGTIDLNLSLRNSAFCEFHHRPYGWSLGTWNALPHLHDSPQQWTYL